MRLFKGKKEAEKILLSLKKKIKEEKLKPGLAVILIGDNAASKLYIKIKRKAARRVGVGFVLYKFAVGESEPKIIQKIKELNGQKSIHGILVQLPLPQGFNTNKIIEAIDAKKDVDGQVLLQAILFALKKGLKDFKGKKIVAVVNSEFFGKALKGFLSSKGIKINYILKRDFSPKKIKAADVIISVCGCRHFIKGGMIKKGVVLIDAGIPPDVDRESVKEKASFLTPFPGGIGPMVVALLLKNVYGSCKIYPPKFSKGKLRRVN